MQVCDELERKFMGQSEKAWEKHPVISRHSPDTALSGQFSQEHQTLIGFQKWRGKRKKRSLICISKSTSSINFSMHNKTHKKLNYHTIMQTLLNWGQIFMSILINCALKWITTTLNKMISNLPIALKESLCHRRCLFLLEAQVKGTGMTPPGEGYWDCRKSERRKETWVNTE